MKRLVVVLALALLACACSPAAPQNRLEIISPHPRAIEDEFGPAFESYYRDKTGSDIKVMWRDMGGTSDDLRYIKSNFAMRPDTIGVDLFFGGGNDPYLQLKGLGLLQSHQVAPEILSGIPKDINGVPLYDPDDYSWYGTAISGFGVIYNKQLLARLGFEGEMKTWADLGNPKLYDWVLAGDPRHSGTVHMMFEIILQGYGWNRGWEVLTALSANARQFVPSAGDIPRAVAAGQVAAGGSIDFYAWTQIASAGADRIGFVMPEGLTVINTDSIGILKGAPNFEAARLFVDFVLSEDGQKLWFLKAGAPGGPVKEALFRMPVRPDLYDKFSTSSAVASNPFKWTKVIKYNSHLATTRYEALNYLLGATVVDNHKLLRDAWKVNIDRGIGADSIGGLAIPPIDEKGLSNLAVSDMKDEARRNEIVTGWVNEARKNYRIMAR